jgi:hypothetical protein
MKELVVAYLVGPAVMLMISAGLWIAEHRHRPHHKDGPLQG